MTVSLRIAVSAACEVTTPCWDVVSNIRNGKVIQFNEATNLKRTPGPDFTHFTHDADTFIVQPCVVATKQHRA